MRRVEFRGFIVFDEDECNYRTNIVGAINHEIFNIEGVRFWQIDEVSNEESDYTDEDEEE